MQQWFESFYIPSDTHLLLNLGENPLTHMKEEAPAIA